MLVMFIFKIIFIEDCGTVIDAFFDVTTPTYIYCISIHLLINIIVLSMLMPAIHLETLTHLHFF